MIPGLILALCAVSISTAAVIEQRGAARWPTSNAYRIAVPGGTGPVLLRAELPAGFNPDSTRVVAEGSGQVVPAKVEWQSPHARISWLAPGPGRYQVYFDVFGHGETKRLPSPAMVGAGEKISHGVAGVRGKLGVGLWAHPAPVDMDGDGALDMVVGCGGKPSNGIYFFRNIGSNAQPLFDRSIWWGAFRKELVAADFNGDGAIDLVQSGGYFNDIRRNLLSQFIPVQLPRGYHVGRDDLWHPVDWDGDGRIDILAGVSDWRDYGWDDAYDAQGKWKNGPLHGYVYFHRNTGSNANPVWAGPVAMAAGGQTLHLRGSPAPNPVDWNGDGTLDLIGGDFIDTMTLFLNTATRGLAAGVPVLADGKPVRMPLCMIQPRIASFHADRRPSLVVGQEDGTVMYLENTARRGLPVQLAAPRYFEQIDPDLKSGVLSRPVVVDWNGDGKLDIISGNSAGTVEYFENIGAPGNPAFAARWELHAGGQPILIRAGASGSIQGPAEEKWGYTNPSVGDWDLDGKPDLLLNAIQGEVLWYRNTGSRTKPVLAAAAPVEVEWSGAVPKPEWNWWSPRGKALVTQWRTTPKIVDWNRDGLPDLVMLDQEGYLALFARYRSGSLLKLKPPQRIFLDEQGKPLLLSRGRAGKSGRRKIEWADWDGDGDLDLVTDEESAVWYENTGSQAAPVLVRRGEIADRKLPGHNPAPAVADWSGDGLLDLIIGAEDGFFYYFDRRYLSTL